MSETVVRLFLRFFNSDNLNRIGMILGFFSFWFAAPELLGEQRLKRLRDSVGLGIRALPSLVAWVLFGALLLTPPIILFFVYRLRLLAYFQWSFSHWSHMLLGEVFEEVTWWLLFLICIAVEAYTFEFMTRYVAKPVLTKLADNSRLRRNSLLLAAILFVSGFMLQFVATFM